MKKILPAVKEKKELSFYPSKLSLLSLPVSRPKSNYYKRTNGRDTLIIESGSWENPKTKELEAVGLPYGIIPRHTLAYLCTKYHQNKRDKENPRIIKLGNCLADFFRNINCTKFGQSYKNMNIQLERFFRCRLNSIYSDDKIYIDKEHRLADTIALWWSPKEADTPALFGSFIGLSPIKRIVN